MVAFFMPDGDGGQLPAEEAESTYANVRRVANSASFWTGTFTDRRVYRLTSHHNGRDYVQRVGDLTSDRLFVLGIFESLDEQGRSRYVVQSLHQTVNVDPEKVVDVEFFDSKVSEE